MMIWATMIWAVHATWQFATLASRSAHLDILPTLK